MYHEIKQYLCNWKKIRIVWERSVQHVHVPRYEGGKIKIQGKGGIFLKNSIFWEKEKLESDGREEQKCLDVRFILFPAK